MEKAGEINTVFWLGTGVMLVFAGCLIFLVLWYQAYFSRMKRVEAEQMLKVSLKAEKKERMRIAADLHDGVLGDLCASRNFLQVFQNKTVRAKENEDVFAEIKSSIEDAIENTRQVSYRLMPPLLERSGLIPTLQDHFENLSARSGIRFKLSCSSEVSISNDKAYELFRIIQEFATNMIKYGGVKKCHVDIDEGAGYLKIAITDDGQPYILADCAKTSGGTGLKNIYSRLKALNADLFQEDCSIGNSFLITLRKEA